MTPRSPYKYLDYYTFDDADLFFGREEVTQKMVGEILSTCLLVLFSPLARGKLRSSMPACGPRWRSSGTKPFMSGWKAIRFRR
jgi:hypothetical protein